MERIRAFAQSLCTGPHGTLYLTCGLLSVLVGLGALIFALCRFRGGKRAKRILSAVQIFTIGVFASVALLFIPICYTDAMFQGERAIFRPLLMAIHSTLRVFILDGEFNVVQNALAGQAPWLLRGYAWHAAVLYVVAPFMTFSNVLFLFKNIRDEFRYKSHIFRKHYIMSELNAKSIALAKSIHNLDKKAVIVFTDVFEQNEEADYELLTEARDINAICLKKDIVHLNIQRKFADVELFLIGENESENVSQAVRITDALNRRDRKRNVKIFVFSQSPSAAYIVDSIQYDNLLRHASDGEYGPHCFKLRRINEKQQLIWNTIPSMKLFDLAQRNGNTLSVLIAGFGSYGFEFFKTLVWYCQFEGYKLEINIVDKQGKETTTEGRIRSIIDRACPELMQTNRVDREGEAFYDIEILSGVDLETADLDRLLQYQGEDAECQRLAQRLRRTNVALVAMGNDDTNIESAVHLRSLFDRIHDIRATDDLSWDQERVQIYAVVYDDQKAGIAHRNTREELVTHKLVDHTDVPYHIHFIGGMSTQFDYPNIYNEAFETDSYAQHRMWVKADQAIYEEWKAMDKPDLEPLENWYFVKECSDEAGKEARKKYEQHEYYRLSSMAKELYNREIQTNLILREKTTCQQEGNRQTCQCANCLLRKRSEHMRWNAYVRIQGYSRTDGKKADRAKLHSNLRPWEELSELDQLKD